MNEDADAREITGVHTMVVEAGMDWQQGYASGAMDSTGKFTAAMKAFAN